ncbi:MAG: ATP-binding protein [Microthrixaceae bacterium]
MSVEPYTWPAVNEFLTRESDLSRLDEWWSVGDREPLAMFGRRRVGKSWLFRRFAHGRPAVVLVAEDLPSGSQMSRFARQLEPVLGVRPELPDVQTLFTVLYRAARHQKILVVIDEFPYLLGATAPERGRTLTALQAVMEEERDQSKLKLVLCGSHIAVMESLFSEKNPLHGRLRRFEVRPLTFADADAFVSHLAPLAAFERYAIAGGVPRYLAALGAGSLSNAVIRAALDKDSPLWDEGRTLVDQELREPRVYFGILEQLAGGAKEINEISQALRIDTSPLSQYLRNLDELRLVSRSVPVGSRASARGGLWQIEDPFLRFWFRFVFPFQADLEAGLRPADLFEGEVKGHVSEHVATVFEAWCQAWTRENHGLVAPQVGRWWGNSLDEFRRDRTRSTEEIDVVGLRRGTATLVGEAKWTTAQMSASIIRDLDTFKVPALKQAGLKIASELRIVLWSKSGYASSLVELARQDQRITLVDVEAVLGQGRTTPQS